MDFFEVVSSRRSVRSFLGREVEAEDLGKLLGCVNAAPSAGNLQGYAVRVIRDAEIRKALSRASLEQKQLVEAPVVLAFLQDKARSARKQAVGT